MVTTTEWEHPNDDDDDDDEDDVDDDDDDGDGVGDDADADADTEYDSWLWWRWWWEWSWWLLLSFSLFLFLLLHDAACALACLQGSTASGGTVEGTLLLRSGHQGTLADRDFSCAISSGVSIIHFTIIYYKCFILYNIFFIWHYTMCIHLN